jgi:hypothetical protein
MAKVFQPRVHVERHAVVERRMLNLKAKLESSLPYSSFKRILPGDFKL